MWNVDPRKIKCTSWIYICPLCTADSRGPAAGAKERDFSQLPKFILINCECITAAICTHLVTSASLASSSGTFYIQLSKPCPPSSMLEFQIPHTSSALARTSFVSTGSHLKALLSSLTPTRNSCFLSSFSSYFTLSLSVFIHTHILPRFLSWDCKYKSIWAILGTNIKTSLSSQCLYPNLAIPSFCRLSAHFTDCH